MVPSRLKPILRLVDLVAVVAAGDEILAAPGDPLHRPARLERRRGDQHLLGIDRALGAEAAADVGHHHADLLRGQLEDGGQRIAQRVGVLRGGPDGQRARVRVVIGQRSARLDEGAGDARVPDLLADDDVALRPRPCPRRRSGRRRAAWCCRATRGSGGLAVTACFRIRGDGQGLVLDLDRLRRRRRPHTRCRRARRRRPRPRSARARAARTGTAKARPL